MNELKATPGPWDASEHGDYSDYDGECIVILGLDTRICVVPGSDDSETYHNAHLIAAAPELYEACLAMVEDGWLYCGPEGMSEAQQKVYDALAKARGE